MTTPVGSPRTHGPGPHRAPAGLGASAPGLVVVAVGAGVLVADRPILDVGLALRGMPAEEYHRELSLRIRRVIPFEAACWHGLDPNTVLLTTANPEELLQGGFLSPETEPLAAEAVVTSEYLRGDFNPFAALALRRAPVGILGQATRVRPPLHVPTAAG